MGLALLSILLVFTIILNLYLFTTLKLEIISIRKRVNLLATKSELSRVADKLRKEKVPKSLTGPVELHYNGQTALVKATFTPQVYRD